MHQQRNGAEVRVFTERVLGGREMANDIMDYEFPISHCIAAP